MEVEPAPEIMLGKVDIHEPMSNSDAATLVMSFQKTDGTYLIRKHPDIDTLAMTVVFKGRATHHLVKINPETGHYTINKKKYGEFNKLEGLIDYLHGKVPGWPVLLTDSVPLHQEKSSAPAVSKVQPKEESPTPQKQESPVPRGPSGSSGSEVVITHKLMDNAQVMTCNFLLELML